MYNEGGWQRRSPAVCSRHRCWSLLHQASKADEETVADVRETVLWGHVVVPSERLLTKERVEQHTHSMGLSCAGSTRLDPLSAWSTQCNPRLSEWTLGKRNMPCTINDDRSGDIWEDITGATGQEIYDRIWEDEQQDGRPSMMTGQEIYGSHPSSIEEL